MKSRVATFQSLTIIFGSIFWNECTTGTAYVRVFPENEHKKLKLHVCTRMRSHAC